MNLIGCYFLFTMCEVNEEFIEIVDDFFNRNPGTSLNSLAKKSGVSEASLRRLVKRQIASPAKIPLLIKTLGFIKQEESIGVLSETVGGTLGRYLRNKTGYPNSGQSSLVLKEEINKLNENPYHLLVLTLGMTKRGISEKEVEDLFGAMGVRSLMLLFEKNLLSLKNGFFFSQRNECFQDAEAIKENLKLLIDNLPYKAELSVAGLNSAGLKKLEKLSLEYMIKQKKLLNNPTLRGTKKIFTFSGQGEFQRKV